MDMTMRQRLVEAAGDVQPREILTFLYRDHPQGASCDGLKEMLFLHEAFEETGLRQLVDAKVLAFDGTRYMIAAEARQVLDRDPTIVLDSK
jgi:hypothetical protein